MLLVVWLLLQAATVTVDRLVAVVGNDPIFLSDLRDVMRLKLLDPSGMVASLSETPGATDDERALQHMINRRLVLAEVARYSQVPPPEPDIAAATKVWQARAPGLPPHEAALVRAFLIDTLRIERYLDQRFTAAAQPTREEARAYYKGTAPFESVEEDVRRQLGEERRLAMVRDWLRGLRDRTAIRILR